MKKIKEGEAFVLHNTVFTYSLSGDEIILKKSAIPPPKEKKQSKAFIPPSLAEVEQYFENNQYSLIAAKKAFDYYSAGEWHDSKGSPIKNWKQKMISVWFRDEYKEKPKSSMEGMVM